MGKPLSFPLTFLFSLLLQAALPLHAAVNDIFAGDFFPHQPGTKTVAIYAYDRNSGGPYAASRKLLDGSVDASILVLRVSQTFRIGDTTITPLMVLPWSQTAVAPAPLAALLGDKAQGLADLRFGAMAWLINDSDSAHYLGVSGMLIAPTGSYNRHRVLNSGENRWKMVLGGGWQKDITPKFLVELAPEIAFYGDNDDYAGGRRLEQHSTYALTGYLPPLGEGKPSPRLRRLPSPAPSAQLAETGRGSLPDRRQFQIPSWLQAPKAPGFRKVNYGRPTQQQSITLANDMADAVNSKVRSGKYTTGSLRCVEGRSIPSGHRWPAACPSCRRACQNAISHRVVFSREAEKIGVVSPTP